MSRVTNTFDELHTLAKGRGLRVMVKLDGDGQMRIWLRDATTVRYSSAEPAEAGQALAHQAHLLVDLLRRSPA